MLHAKDLMIGDWVEFPGGAVDKIVDLPYIEGKGICASLAASATLFPFPISRIKPIPLTPEILKKNGFKDAQFYSELLWNDAFQIISDCDSLSIRCKNSDLSLSIPCYTVHELQNALRLCGIEKEIEL